MNHVRWFAGGASALLVVMVLGFIADKFSPYAEAQREGYSGQRSPAEVDPVWCPTSAPPQCERPSAQPPPPRIQPSGDASPRIPEQDEPSGLMSRAAEPSEPDPNDTAGVVLEIRDSLGSVLDRTVFSEGRTPEGATSRNAFAHHIRRLEQSGASPDDPPQRLRYGPASPCPDGPASQEEDDWQPTDRHLVGVLRYVGRSLDKLAEELEMRSLYRQADQLRDLAQTLRVDARDFNAQPAGSRFLHDQDGFSMDEPAGDRDRPTPVRTDGVIHAIYRQVNTIRHKLDAWWREREERESLQKSFPSLER